MPQHSFQSSGYTSSSGSELDACIRCGKTKRAHDLELTWNDTLYVFESIADAKRAGFYPDAPEVVHG